MAEPVPAGSDCPSCGNGEWTTGTGGDSAQDPYPKG
jgi:hypothetical protein